MKAVMKSSSKGGSTKDGTDDGGMGAGVRLDEEVSREKGRH